MKAKTRKIGSTTYMDNALWDAIDINPKRIQNIIGSRWDVNGQLANTLGRLRDLGRMDLVEEIDEAVNIHNL